MPSKAAVDKAFKEQLQVLRRSGLIDKNANGKNG
jgi:hypothetical protein